MVVGNRACLSIYYAEVACNGGMVYQAESVGVRVVYSSAVRWNQYLIYYVMLSTLIAWFTIKDTVFHFSGMILWKLCTSYFLTFSFS